MIGFFTKTKSPVKNVETEHPFLGAGKDSEQKKYFNLKHDVFKWNILKRKYGEAKYLYLELNKNKKPSSYESRRIEQAKTEYLTLMKKLNELEDKYINDDVFCSCGEYSEKRTGTCNDCYEQYNS